MKYEACLNKDDAKHRKIFKNILGQKIFKE